MHIQEVTPAATKERLDAGDEDLVLVDVRRPEELLLARVAGALHVPMDRIPTSLDLLDRAQDLVVLCHHGIRSARVCLFLQARGYPRVANLRGGIEAWYQEADPTVGRY